MIDLRRFQSSLPACAALDVLEVPVAETMARLGLTFQLWYLWRNGTRKPSPKALWGLTFLAEEAFVKLKEIEKTSQSTMPEASRIQLEYLLQYVRSLLSLQTTMNLSLSPTAKSAAQFQLQQTCQVISTQQSI